MLHDSSLHIESANSQDHLAATATAATAAAPSTTATATAAAATAPSLWTTKCQLSTQPKCHSIILICLQATPVYSTITFFTARATVNCGTIIHQLSVVGPAPILSAVPKYHSTILCQLLPTPTATPLNTATCKPVTTIYYPATFHPLDSNTPPHSCLVLLKYPQVTITQIGRAHV